MKMPLTILPLSLVCLIGCGEYTRRDQTTSVNHGSVARVTTIRDSDGVLTPKGCDDCENLTLLRGGHSKLQGELLRGRWLLIVYGTLSVQDSHFANKSPHVAALLRNTCRVAIRPMEKDEEDVKAWLPELTVQAESAARPIWVLLDGGQMVGARCGFLTDDEIVAFANETDRF